MVAKMTGSNRASRRVPWWVQLGVMLGGFVVGPFAIIRETFDVVAQDPPGATLLSGWNALELVLLAGLNLALFLVLVSTARVLIAVRASSETSE